MSITLGNAQNQTIFGTKEADEINGGAGNDTIIAGKGDDRVLGGSGDDTLRGGQGNDSVRGGNGDDDVRGGRGDDRVGGGAGDDLVRGGAGNDVVSGGIGNNVVMGDGGDDILIGSTTLVSEGDELLSPEYDIMFGGSGSDTFVLATKQKEFYTTFGGADYALIRDLTEIDTVQLMGSASAAYSYETVGGDTQVFSEGDLIAIAKGVDAAFFESRVTFV